MHRAHKFNGACGGIAPISWKLKNSRQVHCHISQSSCTPNPGLPVSLQSFGTPDTLLLFPEIETLRRGDVELENPNAPGIYVASISDGCFDWRPASCRAHSTSFWRRCSFPPDHHRSSTLGARFEGFLAYLYWSKQTWLVWNSDIAVVYVSLSDNRQSQTQAQALQVTQVFYFSIIALVLTITS